MDDEFVDHSLHIAHLEFSDRSIPHDLGVEPGVDHSAYHPLSIFQLGSFEHQLLVT